MTSDVVKNRWRFWTVFWFPAALSGRPGAVKLNIQDAKLAPGKGATAMKKSRRRISGHSGVGPVSSSSPPQATSAQLPSRDPCLPVPLLLHVPVPPFVASAPSAPPRSRGIDPALDPRQNVLSPRVRWIDAVHGDRNTEGYPDRSVVPQSRSIQADHLRPKGEPSPTSPFPVPPPLPRGIRLCASRPRHIHPSIRSQARSMELGHLCPVGGLAQAPLTWHYTKSAGPVAHTGKWNQTCRAIGGATAIARSEQQHTKI